ncbi:hypothetical protein, partial [Flavobacterium psychrophilum]
YLIVWMDGIVFKVR